ncbi:helix-turn-helix domain-containing protein [Sphingomonas sp. GlSt437]|uniref:helix-turn-helix domain-containing protein n=1 Tax=Sphingomonas sp. GlSt437 TaxID=3389970 RepID=UPI003A89A7D1
MEKREMSTDPIKITHFSTAEISPAERYETWLNWGWPRTSQIFRTTPTEPFNTEWQMAMLGDVTFLRTVITGMQYERRIQDIRHSDFDPIIVNMMVDGSAHGVLGERQFHQVSGDVHFHDITQPSRHTSTRSLTYSLILPRSIALVAFNTVTDLHGMVISGPCADLLLAHARHCWEALPALDQACAVPLGLSFLNLLQVGVQSRRPRSPSLTDRISRLRNRAITLIETRLNMPLSSNDICEELKVSRKDLFVAFRSDGGVQSYIRTKRLDLARDALTDVERLEPIGTIALRFGFSDASHFSRLFRARFGVPPRDYRAWMARGDQRIETLADRDQMSAFPHSKR